MEIFLLHDYSHHDFIVDLTGGCMKYDIVEMLKKYWITFVLIAVELVLAAALWTFSQTDSSLFYHSTQAQAYKNIFGFFGSHAASWILYSFGTASWIAMAVGLYAIGFHFFVFSAKTVSLKTEWDRLVGVVFGFLGSAAWCQLYMKAFYSFSYPGGVLGHYLISSTLGSFDVISQTIIVGMVLLSSFFLITRCSYLPVVYAIADAIAYVTDSEKIPARVVGFVFSCISAIISQIGMFAKKSFSVLSGAVLEKIDSSIIQFEQEKNIDQDIEQVVQDLFWDEYITDQQSVHNSVMPSQSLEDHDMESDTENILYDQFTTGDSTTDNFQVEEFVFEKPQVNQVEFISSPVDDFVTPQVQTKKYDLPFVAQQKSEPSVLQEKQEQLAAQARLLEEKLSQFDIKGAVVGMHSGPVVTLFEYEPDSRVKVSRILALEDDLAMALKALSIRIIAPIPGRSVVGFEVANQHRHDVIMAKILHSPEFKKYAGTLPIIFGQDTLGNDVIADLAKMPHLLIAGSTGSGKSVALNAMLVSLLCFLKPDQLQLIIIDPKRLEFAAYDGIGHLIFPIVTDTKKAVPVLKWVVKTMEQRYECMAQYGVRNLSEYQLLAQRNKDMEPMPFIVLIIDEVADLMMTAGKAVEDSIARIAQMARAAGIHMIIATQRPSVDVITGMIKVNFPNRVAFKVTSKIDSRTILDNAGAEKLLGRGDMLFLDASKSQLVRVHGAYISDTEIHDVVFQIKKQCKPQYLDISEQFSNHDSDELFDGDDELYQEIVDFVQELDEVSISMLQRRFRIGYNRSARIISILESKGLIMSVEGGKTRRVVK